MADERGNFLNDGGALTSRTANFYIHKDIQRSYNFMVYFDESDTTGSSFSNLHSYHAVSVELPNYAFKKEDKQVGPFVKSFPILDHNGFEFTIRFEEDSDGIVEKLIRKLVRRNIDSDGFNRSYKETMIDHIVVSIYQANGDNVRKVYFKNCYYLKASTANYSYEDGKQIFYDITFNADHFFEEDNRAAKYQRESGSDLASVLDYFGKNP